MSSNRGNASQKSILKTKTAAPHESTSKNHEKPSRNVELDEFINDLMLAPPNWEAEIWDWPLQRNDGMAHLVNTKERFEVALEMATFTPKEIQVKVCGTDLVICCNHDEKGDPVGFMSRNLFRSYHLPADIDLRTLKSRLTNRGILHITANKLPS